MLIENIVTTLFEYIVHNDFNGFYDYLIDKLEYSTDTECNLIVETFINNLKYEKYYNMYAPVVKSALERELNKRKVVSSNEDFKEKDIPLDTPLINDLKTHLKNKDFQSFIETSFSLANEAKDQEELNRIISTVGTLIQKSRKDKSFYEKCYKAFREIVVASPLHQEEMQNLKEFIDNQKIGIKK